MTSISWVKLLPTIIEEAKAMLRVTGEPPTLRALHYRLVSKDLIPNTRSMYTRLSQVLTAKRYEGEYPWGLLKDETRIKIEPSGTNTLEEIRKDSKNIDISSLFDLQEKLETIFKTAVRYDVDRWERQPRRVVICLEKAALLDFVKRVALWWEVPVYCMRGYTSTTQVKDLADHISETGGEVIILMLGDFDPTGEDIVRNLREKLHTEFGHNCLVDKIGITLEQIDEYNLPSTPESSEERAKMERDTRYKNWDHGFFRVELDALLAYVPEKFKEIISEAIKNQYDPDIWEQVNDEVLICQEKAREKLESIQGALTPTKEIINRMIEDAIMN